jgi:nitroreductase
VNAIGQEELLEAARLALAAPSIFNTQPWLWAVGMDRMELRADRSRQLLAVDPGGRLLTISCGVALHHAAVALAGYEMEISLLPNARDRELLAVVHASGEAHIDRGQQQLREAIRKRRTDRRTFGQAPLAGEVLDRLVAACQRQGAHLHQVPWQHMATLALAAVSAGALQLSDPEYRAELADWTHRPPWSGDGVPVETAVERAPRRVPVRDFAPFGGQAMPAGADNDFGAFYGIIYTDTDTPEAWLHAGMSLSAVLLTATAAGLGSAPISDVTEAGAVREHLRQVLPSGHPQVAVRIGHPQAGEPPSTPRRLAEEVITVMPG